MPKAETIEAPLGAAPRTRMRDCIVSLTSAFALISLSAAAQAQAIRHFCAAAEKPVGADARLSQAVAAAFGPVSFTSTADECIYPLKVLRYAGADVLLTQGNVPGEACHGCDAHLSAFVLQRTGGGLKLVKRLPDFAQTGSNGAVGDISPLTIGSDDGLVVEGGGVFQGYAFNDLDLYVFRAGRVVHLQAEPSITISADDSGAFTDDTKAISVTGSWSMDTASHTDLAVDYKIAARGRTTVERVVWSVRGDRLVITKGRLPPEVGQASGRE